MELNIHFDDSWIETFLHKLEQDGPWSNWNLYNLALEAEKNLNTPPIFMVYRLRSSYPN